MTSWGPGVYGDPCRDCGFAWLTPMPELVTGVAGLPASYAAAVVGASGEERTERLDWSVSAYVSHVADNLRIWSERLVGATAGTSAGAPSTVAGYDEAALAVVRAYDRIPLTAARWSLGRSVDGWLSAVRKAPATGTVLVHPDRGPLALGDVVASNAHDAVHHRWDIACILGRARPVLT